MKKQLLHAVAITLVLGTAIPQVFAASGTAKARPKAAPSIVVSAAGTELSHPEEYAVKAHGQWLNYLPLYYIEAALKKTGYKVVWNGVHRTLDITTPASHRAISPLKVGSGNTRIHVNGKLVKHVTTFVRKAPNAGPKAVPTTYVSVQDMQSVLQSFGVQTVWSPAKLKWSIATGVALVDGQVFGPTHGTLTIKDNVFLNGTATTLRNTKVNGNVYVNPGSNGTVALDSVHVTGSIIVLSGASHSIHLNNTTATTLEVNSSSPVHIVARGTTSVGSTVIVSGESKGVTLDQQSGSFGQVKVASNSTIVLTGSQPFSNVTFTGNVTVVVSAGTKIDNLDISGSNVKVQVQAGAEVGSLTVQADTKVAIVNDGTVATVVNHASSGAVEVSGSGKVNNVKGNKVTDLGEGTGPGSGSGGKTPGETGSGGGTTPGTGAGGGTTPGGSGLGGGTTPGGSGGGGGGTTTTPVSTNSLVSLGDSITYGYNLGSNTAVSPYAFPEVMGTTDGFKSVTDLAQPGYNSHDVLGQLSDPTVRTNLANATVITLDIGSNDLLLAAASVLADYKAGNATQMLADENSLLATMPGVITSMGQNVGQILAGIRQLNPTAPIVLYNLYNPFPDGTGSVGTLHALGEEMIAAANQAIQAPSQAVSNVHLVDAYTAFNGNQMADVRVPEGDVHPTIEGQIVLARLAEAALSLTKTQDFVAPVTSTQGELDLLNKVVSQLNTLHDALVTTGGLAAIQAAETQVQSADWVNILYGGTTPPANAGTLTQTIKDLVSLLTYSGLSSNTGLDSSNFTGIVADIEKLNPSITTADIYNFYLAFQGALSKEVLSSSAGSTIPDILLTALETAANSTPGTSGAFPFNILGSYGLTANDIVAIRTRFQTAVDPSNAAQNALIKAIGVIELEKVHAALQASPASLVAVNAAEGELKSLTLSDWTAMIGSPTVAQAVYDVMPLVSYTAFTSPTMSPGTFSNLETKFLVDFPSVQPAELANLVTNLQTNLMGTVGQVLSSGSLSSGMSSVIGSAINKAIAETTDVSGKPLSTTIFAGVDFSQVLAKLDSNQAQLPDLHAAEFDLALAMISVYNSQMGTL